MKLLLAVLLSLAANAFAANPPYYGVVLSTPTGKAVQYISGEVRVAKSSTTAATTKILLDGAAGSVSASSLTATYGVTAATGSFTATGNTQYSLTTSSGISVGAGGVTAAFFSGAVSGNAATATSLAANGSNCAAQNFPLGVDASGNAESCNNSISGNAATSTMLAANGTNCSAGNYPLGVDASGNSESCTAAGIGDVTQVGNNTFTGTNKLTGYTTFTGPISAQGSLYVNAASTVGPQGYVTAITKSSGTFNNMWNVVASNNPSAVSSLSFTGLTANRFYRIHYNLKQNTSVGIFQAKFNNDGSVLYAVTDTCNSSNASSDNYASAGATFWRIEGVGTAINGYRQGFIEFSTLEDNSSYTNVSGLSTFWANASIPPIMTGCHSHVVYTGGSTITSIQLGVDAGTFTGFVYVEEFIVPNP